MFAQLNPPTVRRQRWLLAASVAIHGLALIWLLREPEALLLSPTSVAVGENGTSLTRLYWSSKLHDNSTHSSPDTATQKYSHQRLSQNKLTWKTPAQLAKLASQNPLSRAEADDKAQTQTLSALGHGAQAGATYGTLSQGQLYGDEVRRRASHSDFRSRRLSLAIAHHSRKRSHRNHHQRAGRDRSQDGAAEPGRGYRHQMFGRARELALSSRNSQRLAHPFQAGRHLSFQSPRLVERGAASPAIIEW